MLFLKFLSKNDLYRAIKKLNIFKDVDNNSQTKFFSQILTTFL